MAKSEKIDPTLWQNLKNRPYSKAKMKIIDPTLLYGLLPELFRIIYVHFFKQVSPFVKLPCSMAYGENYDPGLWQIG